LPGKEGLCHISKLSIRRVKNVTDVVHEGKIVTVKVVGKDEKGRIDLSMISDNNSSISNNYNKNRSNNRQNESRKYRR